MLLGKQTYCYSYIDAYEKLEETEFPGIDKFYNKLYERHITAEEYSHAHRVYTELKLATLGDYAALYLVRFFTNSVFYRLVSRSLMMRYLRPTLFYFCRGWMSFSSVTYF